MRTIDRAALARYFIEAHDVLFGVTREVDNSNGGMLREPGAARSILLSMIAGDVKKIFLLIADRLDRERLVQWEYLVELKHFRLGFGASEEAQEQLTRRGDEGWEAISIEWGEVDELISLRAVYKRRRVVEEARES